MNHNTPCTRQSPSETMACPRTYAVIRVEDQRSTEGASSFGRLGSTSCPA
jgi:hypothetical protein